MQLSVWIGESHVQGVLSSGIRTSCAQLGGIRTKSF
jgi:hypothetical protein